MTRTDIPSGGFVKKGKVMPLGFTMSDALFNSIFSQLADEKSVAR